MQFRDRDAEAGTGDPSQDGAAELPLADLTLEERKDLVQRRLTAGFIDVVIFLIYWGIFSYVFGVFFAQTNAALERVDTPSATHHAEFWGLIIALLFSWIYSAYMTGAANAKYFRINPAMGRSPGMYGAHTALRDANDGYATIGVGRATLRWLYCVILTGLFLIPAIVSIVLSLGDPKGQTWYDRATGSAIISANDDTLDPDKVY